MELRDAEVHIALRYVWSKALRESHDAFGPELLLPLANDIVGEEDAQVEDSEDS